MPIPPGVKGIEFVIKLIPPMNAPFKYNIIFISKSKDVRAKTR